MKTKKIISVFLVLFFANFIFAQTDDFKFYSSANDGDKLNNYKGYAAAEFITDEADMFFLFKIIFDDYFPVSIYDLSDNDLWLAKKAIADLNYNEEFIAVIAISEEEDPDEALMLFSWVSEDNFVVDIMGAYISEDEIDTFFDDMDNVFESLSDEALEQLEDYFLELSE